MKIFRDALDRDWQIAVNVGTLKQVRDLLGGLWLPDLVNEKCKPLGELLSDDCRLVDVLCALCRPQLKALDVSDEEFAAGFAGDALDRAADAFLEEFIGFFREPRVREALKKVRETANLVRADLHQEMDQVLQTIDARAIANKALAKLKADATRRDSATSSPDMSASTPSA